uniref:Uncharacterized protein n=1 Tax=Seriola lalandi dorsalis TaxID=1841481 RepID=A0A3B4XXA0_SERLL
MLTDFFSHDDSITSTTCLLLLLLVHLYYCYHDDKVLVYLPLVHYRGSYPKVKKNDLQNTTKLGTPLINIPTMLNDSKMTSHEPLRTVYKKKIVTYKSTKSRPDEGWLHVLWSDETKMNLFAVDAVGLHDLKNVGRRESFQHDNDLKHCQTHTKVFKEDKIVLGVSGGQCTLSCCSLLWQQHV